MLVYVLLCTTHALSQCVHPWCYFACRYSYWSISFIYLFLRRRQKNLFVQTVWILFENCLNIVWILFENWLSTVRKLFENCLNNFENCLNTVWKLFELLPGKGWVVRSEPAPTDLLCLRSWYLLVRWLVLCLKIVPSRCVDRVVVRAWLDSTTSVFPFDFHLYSCERRAQQLQQRAAGSDFLHMPVKDGRRVRCATYTIV